MRQLNRTPAAEKDWDEILAWLLEYNPASVDRIVDAIEAKCKLLSSQPLIGRSRDDLYPGLRSVVIEWYVMFYMALDDQKILIHRIIHGSRNITPDQFPGE